MPHGRLPILCLAILLITPLTACEDKRKVAVAETKINILEDMVGRGRPARRGDLVCIDFSVKTENSGEELLWGRNFCYRLGAGVVVAGFNDAVEGMQKGGRRKLACPPHLHWGRGGYAKKIPANTSLLFEIRMLSIE